MACPVAGLPAVRASGKLPEVRVNDPLKDRKGRVVLAFAPSAADYAGRVELLGSDDLVNWRALASGPLAHERRLGDVIERNRFEVQAPPSFLRVAWNGSAAPQIGAARFEDGQLGVQSARSEGG